MPMGMGRTPLIGSALTQPVLPSQGAQANPEQVGLWGKFQNRLQQDPNLRMALLTTGLNLLRTPQPGQTGFDVFSDAALTGVNTLDQLRQRQRSQTIEEDERARTADIEAREISDREARTGAINRRTTASANQFMERMRLAREQFSEEKRQFDERLKAGDFSAAGTTSTGQERLLDASVNALVTAMPEIYPDTPEGRAKARLRATGLTGVTDPEGQARIMASLYSDIAANQPFLDEEERLSEDEIVNRVTEIYKTFSGAGAEPAEAAPAADPLEGREVTNPTTQETGRIVKVGEDQYVMEFSAGQTRPLTREQMEQVLRGQQ